MNSHLIIVQPDGVTTAGIIKNIAEALFKDAPHPAAALRNAYTVKEFISVKEMRSEYPDGVPESAVSIIGDKLKDGRSKDFFDLFGLEARKKTIFFSRTDMSEIFLRTEGFIYFMPWDSGREGIEKMTQLAIKLLHE